MWGITDHRLLDRDAEQVSAHLLRGDLQGLALRAHPDCEVMFRRRTIHVRVLRPEEFDNDGMSEWTSYVASYSDLVAAAKPLLKAAIIDYDQQFFAGAGAGPGANMGFLGGSLGAKSIWVIRLGGGVRRLREMVTLRGLDRSFRVRWLG